MVRTVGSAVSNNKSQPIIINNLEEDRGDGSTKRRRLRWNLPNITKWAFSNPKQSCNKLLAACHGSDSRRHTVLA